MQRDVPGTHAIIETGLSRFPGQRELLALNAAAAALTYDESATAEAMRRFNQVSPGNPLGDVHPSAATSRPHDSTNRPEAMLRQAVALAPNWPAPRIELGLLLMQAAAR